MLSKPPSAGSRERLRQGSGKEGLLGTWGRPRGRREGLDLQSSVPGQVTASLLEMTGAPVSQPTPLGAPGPKGPRKSGPTYPTPLHNLLARGLWLPFLQAQPSKGPAKGTTFSSPETTESIVLLMIPEGGAAEPDPMPLTSCVTLCKALNVSEPQFPPL